MRGKWTSNDDDDDDDADVVEKEKQYPDLSIYTHARSLAIVAESAQA